MLPIGGGFDHLRGWVRHLDHDRYAVTLCYASPRSDEVAQRIAADGPVALLPTPALHSAPRLFVPGIRALRRAIADVRPDIVHSVFIQSDILAALASVANGRPQLSSVFGYLFRGEIGRTKTALYRAGYALARRRYAMVTAISNATAEELRRDFHVDRRKIRILRSGLDFSRVDPTMPALEDRSPGGSSIAIAAQLIPEKGVDLFLEAMALVARVRSGLQVTIAGDGPDRAMLERLTARLGIADRVRFLGEIQGVPALLRTVDVLVCAARPGFDGVPRVALEAMASGAVVVTTKVGGVAEVVRDGIDGVVLDRPDAARLARSITEVTGDAALRSRLRRSALDRVHAFDARREVVELQGIYDELASVAAQQAVG